MKRAALAVTLLALAALGYPAAPDSLGDLRRIRAVSAPHEGSAPHISTAAGGQAEGGPALAFTAEGTMNARAWGAFGGGLALGWDVNGTTLGVRAVYNYNGEPMRVLETLFFARLYLPSLQGRSGFFAQLEAGPGFIFEDDWVVGAVNAGLMAGWRFLLGRRWFVEPFVRAGHPFIAGAGAGAGLRW